MLQLWMIGLVVVIYLHDELGRATGRAASAPVSGWSLLLALSPYIALAGLTHLVCWASAKELDRSGSHRAVDSADWMVAASRVMGMLVYAIGVFSLGWCEQVRAVVGNPVVIDELIIVAPPLLLFVAGWWSYYPIERRLRDAMTMRVLDQGTPVYPTPTRKQYLFSNFRHQILFMLVPLMMMRGLTESIEWVARGLSHLRFAGGIAGNAARWVWSSPWLAENIFDAARLLGVLGVFIITPLMMRLVWDAIPLGPGDLRDRLMRVCTNAGVRVRELLVWRTHGTMLNGLAMGVVAPLRYIMLTDALLDNLPRRQVEGVMGHEVGHAKHHHIAWMVLGVMALGGVAKVAMVAGLLVIGLGAEGLWPGISQSRGWGPILIELMAAGVSIGVFVGAIFVFGFVSRRFEWQADAFAAKQLSKDTEGATVVTEEGAGAMREALESVSRLNHIPRHRRSFRHGSLARRQDRLTKLIGTPLERMPIDRTVRWIKRAIIVGLLVAIAGAFIEVRPMGAGGMAYVVPSAAEQWQMIEQRRTVPPFLLKERATLEDAL